MTAPTPDLGWTDAGQVDWYLDRIGALAPRLAGEEVLADALPDDARRVLDLGCGDGRLSSLVLDTCPGVEEVIALDRSAPMLERARQRFADDDRVEVREGDLADSIDDLGPFDLVVSGFAIHHLPDHRKRALFGEITTALEPSGLFANLEIVASATPELHAEFLRRIGRDRDDPEDRLAPVDDQLIWMRDAGLVQVDCLWRWRGMALLVGRARARA
jgi:SAM-dependent methyltransferase